MEDIPPGDFKWWNLGEENNGLKWSWMKTKMKPSPRLRKGEGDEISGLKALLFPLHLSLRRHKVLHAHPSREIRRQEGEELTNNKSWQLIRTNKFQPGSRASSNFVRFIPRLKSVQIRVSKKRGKFFTMQVQQCHLIHSNAFQIEENKNLN